MPSNVSIIQLGKAVLDSVQNGSYPDSEDIISADFPPSAFPQALELLYNARKDIQGRVRRTSSDSAQDIDGWISQAKQLRSDIEVAQRSSRDILTKSERNVELRQNVHDTASKLRLLEEEVTFNQSLAAILVQLQAIRHKTSQIQDAVDKDDLLEAVGLSINIETELASIHNGRNVKAVALLQGETKDLQQVILRTLTQRWYDVVRIDDQASTVFISSKTEAFPTVMTAIQRIGLLGDFLADLAEKLERIIVVPRLSQEHLLIVESDSMKIPAASSPTDMHRLFSDLCIFIEFLQTHLPPPIIGPLSEILGPTLVEKLISMRLSLAVPEELAALQDFNSIREEVYQFSQTLSSYRWPGVEQLRAWPSSIPEAWLEKRRRTSLDKIRQLLKRGFRDISTVERVETQIVSRQDHLFTGNLSNDDWDAEWSDREDGSPAGKKVEPQALVGNDDEEDGSAWGLNEEDESADSEDIAPPVDEDVEGDAWGWGNDNEVEEIPKTSKRKSIQMSKQDVNGHRDVRQRSEREITLKETFNITSLPIGLLDMVNSILADLDVLGERSLSDPTTASVVPGLSKLPSFLLVMYRASASTFYSINNSGNMFLYNDCLWLVDQLRRIVQARMQNRHKASTNGTDHLYFDDDIVALEAFGKRSYGKEMDSQRTIIKDLLDGAQGFANCTEPPFSSECDLAVTSIVDRLRELHMQWKKVLSHSALLQSIGSLLSTVIDKIIIDIEDMSDISEPESKRLTAYCKQITTLEDLFFPLQQETEADQQQDPVPLTAVYAPGWFKFQYLSEILDSSLADIKYLWTDGGLKLEYEVEEVADLIEALFADSEHRRRAIGEIKRSMGR